MPTRVLLVEDVVELRFVIRHVLERRGGFEIVDEAGDGAAALQSAARHQPDVVVLDLGLPDVAGQELVSRLQAVGPNCQVVIYTGSHASPPVAFGGSVAAYLTKDQDVSSLADLLGRLDVAPCQTAAIEVGPDPGDVSLARRFLKEHCQDWDCADLISDAELLVSELVTNALVHTRARCELRAGLSATALRLQVIDGAAAVPDLRVAGEGDENGRGLLLVSALCAAWGTEPLPLGGKVVWAEMLRSGEDEGHEQPEETPLTIRASRPG